MTKEKASRKVESRTASSSSSSSSSSLPGRATSNAAAGEGGGGSSVEPLWDLVLKEVVLPERQRATWNSYYDDVVAFVKQKVRSGGETRTTALLTVVEVGTAYGGLADKLAGKLRRANVYAVDPLLGGYDSKDSQSDKLSAWALKHIPTTEISSSACSSSSSPPAAAAATSSSFPPASTTTAGGGGVDATRNATALGCQNDEKARDLQFSDAWGEALVVDQRRRHGCRYHLLKMTSAEAAPFFEDGSVDVVFVDGLHTYEGVSTDINAWARKLKRPGGMFLFNDVDESGLNGFPGVFRAVDDFAKASGRAVHMGELTVPPGFSNAAVFM